MDIDRPLVSVIVPVYNVRPYMCEALDSVINQTYDNLEIIVVDDGSTDGGGEICDEYAAKDKRIKVIHQDNQGLAAARNVGLDLMQGEYVAFLDSDDAFFPGFVEKMLEALQKTGADMAICKHAAFPTVGKMEPDGKERVQSHAPPGCYDRIASFRCLMDGAFHMFACIKLYRREIWNYMRFPFGRTHEDMDTSYKVIDRCKSVCMLGEVLYKYRLRPGSISHTMSTKHLKDYFIAGVHIDDFIEAHKEEIFGDGESYRPMMDRMVNSFVQRLTFGALHGKYKFQMDGGEEVDTDNLQWVMSTERGRQFVSEVLDLCGTGANCGSGIESRDFYLIGRRSVGEDLLHQIRRIEADNETSDGLALEYNMMREAQRRKDENNG